MNDGSYARPNERAVGCGKWEGLLAVDIEMNEDASVPVWPAGTPVIFEIGSGRSNGLATATTPTGEHDTFDVLRKEVRVTRKIDSGVSLAITLLKPLSAYREKAEMSTN